MMHFETYHQYVSYDLKTYFSKMPGDMICCPMCEGSLTKSKIKPSKHVIDSLSEQGMIPMYNFSYLFTCNSCHWWYIRESYDYCEIQQTYDSIVTGVVAKWDLSARRKTFASLKEYIERKRRSLNLKVLDVEMAASLAVEFSKLESQTRRVSYIGTGMGADNDEHYVYSILERPVRDSDKGEDDTHWLFMLRRELPDKGAEQIHAIDIINGRFTRHGQPADLMVTHTDLLMETEPWVEKLLLLKPTPEAEAREFREYVNKKRLREFRRAFRIRLLENSAIQRLLERPLRGSDRGLENPTSEQTEPWQKALNDERLYDDSLNLPEEYGKLFRDA